MKKLTLLFLILLVITACNNANNKTDFQKTEEVSTTYYLIRHAEKDRSDPSNSNPNLTPEGMERAQNWAQYFEKIKIDQIYSTDFNRTKQTAASVAKQKDLMIESYDPSDLYNADFRTLTQGNNVIVVGHSNTTPQFVNAILGEDEYTDIPDDENGMLFIVSVKGNDKNVQLFTVD